MISDRTLSYRKHCNERLPNMLRKL